MDDSHAKLSLLKAGFLTAVAGRRIVDVELRLKDAMGHEAVGGEVILSSLLLDDGTSIELTASAQIGYDDVWALAVPPSGPNG